MLEVCAWKKGFSLFSGDLTTHICERLYVSQDANMGKSEPRDDLEVCPLGGHSAGLSCSQRPVGLGCESEGPGMDMCKQCMQGWSCRYLGS